MRCRPHLGQGLFELLRQLMPAVVLLQLAAARHVALQVTQVHQPLHVADVRTQSVGQGLDVEGHLRVVPQVVADVEVEVVEALLALGAHPSARCGEYLAAQSARYQSHVRYLLR